MLLTNVLAVLALATVLVAKTTANAVRLIQSGAVSLGCSRFRLYLSS